MNTLFLCLLAVSSVFAFPQQADQPAPSGGSKSGGCPGGYSDGAEVERGRLVYTCTGGTLVAKACITPQLTRINIGETFDQGSTRYKCSGTSFDVEGCVKDGKVTKTGETFEDAGAFYSCDAEGAGVKIVNKGCVDGGKRVNKGEKVQKEDALYVCEEQVNNNAKLVVAGCSKGGKSFNPGDTFDDGKIVFNCTRIGREKVVPKPTGCVVGGKRLNDGDRYNEAGVFYECRIDNNQLNIIATGCAQGEGGNVIERKLGCTWVEGTAPLQIEVACHADGANKAVKTQVRCNYNVGGGVYNIEPGTYRQVDKGYAGCVKNGDNLQTAAYPDEKAAQGAGLKSA
jgi:hypothetical protein